MRPSDANETVLVLAGRSGAARRTHGPGAHPPEPAGARPDRARRGRGPAQGRLRPQGCSWTADPDIILMATGSEVEIALAAADTLSAEGVAVRVVALPSWELFQLQDEAYRESCAASNRHGAGLSGGGVHLRVGPLRRLCRGGHRHRPLRGFGAGQGAVQGVRHHRGEHGDSGSQGTGWIGRLGETHDGSGRRSPQVQDPPR